MKAHVWAIGCIITIYLLAGCYRGPKLTGSWRLEKINVLSQGQLMRCILDTAQVWHIYPTDSIGIYDDNGRQKCLLVKMRRGSIISLNEEDKSVREVFSIEQTEKGKLELSSVQHINGDAYELVYYLEKISGLATNDIKVDTAK